jgi:hypothetical protein
MEALLEMATESRAEKDGPDMGPFHCDDKLDSYE